MPFSMNRATGTLSPIASTSNGEDIANSDSSMGRASQPIVYALWKKKLPYVSLLIWYISLSSGRYGSHFLAPDFGKSESFFQSSAYQ